MTAEASKTFDEEAVRRMMQEDRAAWEELVAVLDSHPEGPVHDPDAPDWTARDVFTHFACLRELCARQMDQYLSGRDVEDPYGGADENDVNATIQQLYGHMSLEDARDWAIHAFEILMLRMKAVPLERWDAMLERYARADGAGHCRRHMGYIGS